MSNLTLPRGLRHVIVHVALGTDFPPAANSSGDIALLRSANRAMLRKTQGVEDAFLFIVVGRYSEEKVAEAVAVYGFQNATVICMEAGDVERRLKMGEEIIPGEVGNAVEKWICSEHSGAVAYFSQDYPDTEFWWSGVEHDDDVFHWPFGDGDFAQALPTSHHSRAATWLTILGHAVGLHVIQSNGPDALAGDISGAWAATLCEWLHGFEAASGNGGNDFESEFSAVLMPSEFYLGFELARLSGDNLESICDDAETDVDSLPIVALKAITADRRSELRDALSNFFGGDSCLFWALYSAIWPSYADNYPKPMREALELEIGSACFNDVANHDTPWRYVTEGWCDDADD